jgi:hypothetical protein
MAGTVKLNLAKTLEATAGNSMFIDVPKDGEVRVRILPPLEEMEGNLWFLTENHFRLKGEDGQKGIAVACRHRHAGGDACFLCDAAKFLEQSDDPQERAIGKGREAIAANRSWYFQVLPISKDGSGNFVAGEVKLLRLPKTGADAVNDILKTQMKNDDPVSCMEDAAQDIVISRQDTGVPITKYKAMTAGKPKSLDDYKPDWKSKLMSKDEVMAKLDLKIYSNEEQIEALRRSYALLDTPNIVAECGY